MNNFEPSEDSFKQDLIFSKDILGVVIGGDKEPLMTQGDLGSFHLSSTSVPVSPYLEVVTQAISFLIEVVDQNGLLSNIAVKPFVLRLEVQTLLLLSNKPGFANSRGPYIQIPLTSEASRGWIFA